MFQCPPAKPQAWPSALGLLLLRTHKQIRKIINQQHRRGRPLSLATAPAASGGNPPLVVLIALGAAALPSSLLLILRCRVNDGIRQAAALPSGLSDGASSGNLQTVETTEHDP